MNKKDIQLEMNTSMHELRKWSESLAPASSALARLFLDQAGQIESSLAGRGFDSFGATVMMGKVNGLILAARTLLDEWKANQ